jgi:diguanylate cyclase (GGDEF)-like protein
VTQEGSTTDAILAASDHRQIATELGVEDILVFVRAGDGFRLIGGVGRGGGWAEIVEVRTSEEPIADRAWKAGVPVRTSAPTAVRIIGPYWARNGVTVPVGLDHLVVFGGSTAVTASDAHLARAASRVVSNSHDVPAEKLLADELELVHAVRGLMAYRAENVADTARHIALVAARALSCEVAAIHVLSGSDGLLELIRLGGADGFETDPSIGGPDALGYLSDAMSMIEPRVEQSVNVVPRIWTDEIVSRLTLPIGGAQPLGAMSLGHAVSRPRGFTALCQRIGRAISESAELLLSQAIVREQLAAERDVLRQATLTDSLTGVGNRAAWDEAMASMASGDGEALSFAILSIDLDELKSVNDRFGHATGDAVIRGAANLLNASIRTGDLLARVGGDEFLVLLPAADAKAARRVARRIGRHLAFWRVTEHDLAPEMSVGWAVANGDPRLAMQRADERMYLAKRRRARNRRLRVDSHSVVNRRRPQGHPV